jgi:hypothetical protein
MLKPGHGGRGYLHVVLYSRGVMYQHAVHRLVTAAFIGPCPPGQQVNHRDGHKLNNALTNLEYVTPKENVRHGRALGLDPNVGETHPNAKLTEHDVREIRRRYRAKGKGETIYQLAAAFGVTFSNVGYIVRRKAWSHI